MLKAVRECLYLIIAIKDFGKLLLLLVKLQRRPPGVSKLLQL
jgi:hypothetical protein